MKLNNLHPPFQRRNDQNRRGVRRSEQIVIHSVRLSPSCRPRELDDSGDPLEFMQAKSNPPNVGLPQPGNEEVAGRTKDRRYRV
jgi:hypothetical protein